MLRYFFSVSVNAFSARSLCLCCISFSPALRMDLNRAPASVLWVRLWRAGRETGCAFLYGVIAIGVVYQEMTFENWWATACWVLYTSKLSSSLLFLVLS